ncbi:hypothetical protein LEP1GSC008_4514 [Leptospira kirschneri serovar Bulgarica str. Nikolaevo]|uniref:Uncharacterized protein n=1 Tax=Leptospira kirschneri serovar Bulgarica str. Nikolaevo TaxID=1240687 RepID=M6F9Q7_9LEPT|nr:hypothetical protein LEP1GSC008_4514 [Leptospira kirschneri serovar Bulgarica str. Nikolaevo]
MKTSTKKFNDKRVAQKLIRKDTIHENYCKFTFYGQVLTLL